MNKIEKHLKRTGAFRDLDPLTLDSEHTDKFSGYIHCLRRWSRSISDDEAPWCWSKHKPQSHHSTRIMYLWLFGSYRDLMVGRSHWTGHYKPSRKAPMLLSLICRNDPHGEGVTETNWTCTNEGRRIQERQDLVDFCVLQRWLKESHPYLDLTEAGRKRVVQYRAESKMPHCDICGEPVESEEENLCPVCGENFVRDAADDWDDPVPRDEDDDDERFDHDPTLDEYDDE